jgi:hypothetical protein
VLSVHVSQASNLLRFWRLGWRVFWVAALVIFPICYDDLRAGSTKPAAVPFLYVVFTSGPAAGFMSLVEIIVASGIRRWLFVALWLGALAGAVVGFGESGLGPFCLLAIYLAGSFVVVIRWLEVRKLRPLLLLVEADLRTGTVVSFELTSVHQLPKSVARKHASTEEMIRVDALPRSGVVVGLDGSFLDSFVGADSTWQPLEVTTTGHGAGLEVPIHTLDASGEAQGELSQRHATAAELQEMSNHRKRMLRRSLGSLFAVTYFAAFGIRFVEMLLEGGMKTTLSPLGWAIAAVIGGLSALRPFRTSLGLRRAISQARVLGIRRADAGGGAPKKLEVLPATHLLWSIEGRPAPWRTVKW